LVHCTFYMTHHTEWQPLAGRNFMYSNPYLCAYSLVKIQRESSPWLMYRAVNTRAVGRYPLRGGAVKSLARPTSRCRRTESWKTAGFRLDQ
jgi:hypothetical protein